VPFSAPARLPYPRSPQVPANLQRLQLPQACFPDQRPHSPEVHQRNPPPPHVMHCHRRPNHIILIEARLAHLHLYILSPSVLLSFPPPSHTSFLFLAPPPYSWQAWPATDRERPAAIEQKKAAAVAHGSATPATGRSDRSKGDVGGLNPLRDVGSGAENARHKGGARGAGAGQASKALGDAPMQPRRPLGTRQPPPEPQRYPALPPGQRGPIGGGGGGAPSRPGHGGQQRPGARGYGGGGGGRGKSPPPPVGASAAAQYGANGRRMSAYAYR